MNLDFCVIQKKRIIANEVETMTLSDPDKVRGRVAVLIDDMIDTCGTLVLAVRKLKEAGATKVYAIATHGIFSGQAIERIENSEDLDLVVVTNTIPKLESCEKIRWIDVSPLFAQAIIEASA
jgi:ribose-phosphate pyrophosphokinase